MLRRSIIMAGVGLAVMASSGALAVMASPGALAAEGPGDVSDLKGDVTLSHEDFRAAKRICVALLVATEKQHKLPSAELAQMMHACSYGQFDLMAHRLESDLKMESAVHHGNNGPELVDAWEIEIRDAIKFVEGQGGAGQ